jgi:hypothetical protein
MAKITQAFAFKRLSSPLQALASSFCTASAETRARRSLRRKLGLLLAKRR